MWPFKNKNAASPSADAVGRITKTLQGTVDQVEDLSTRTTSLQTQVSDLRQNHQQTSGRVSKLEQEVDALKTIPFDPAPYDAMDVKLSKMSGQK